MDALAFILLICVFIISVLALRKLKKGLYISIIWLALSTFLVSKFFFDAFLLSLFPNNDGTPVTGIMRLFMLNDNVNLSINTGIATSLLFLLVCSALFIFCLLKFIKSK